MRHEVIGRIAWPDAQLLHLQRSAARGRCYDAPIYRQVLAIPIDLRLQGGDLLTDLLVFAGRAGLQRLQLRDLRMQFLDLAFQSGGHLLQLTALLACARAIEAGAVAAEFKHHVQRKQTDQDRRRAQHHRAHGSVAPDDELAGGVGHGWLAARGGLIPPGRQRRRPLRKGQCRQFPQHLHVHGALEENHFAHRLPPPRPAPLVEFGLRGGGEVQTSRPPAAAAAGYQRCFWPMHSGSCSRRT